MILFLFSGCARKQEDVNNEVVPVDVVGQEAKIKSQPEGAEEKVAQSLGRANPFLTEEEEQGLKELGNAIPIDYFQLSAILCSASLSRAVINGRILEIGDVIDNKIVERIESEAVFLKDARGEYIARLKKVDKQ